MGTIRSKRFIYRTGVTWIAEKKAKLTAEGKPPLEVATAPEFKGPEGIWSPEECFVASVNACVLTTFLAIAEKYSVRFISYESYAEGTLEMAEGKFMFTRVVLHPKVVVESDEMVASVERALAGAEKRCLISNSVRSEVIIKPHIEKAVGIAN